MKDTNVLPSYRAWERMRSRHRQPPLDPVKRALMNRVAREHGDPGRDGWCGLQGFLVWARLTPDESSLPRRALVTLEDWTKRSPKRFRAETHGVRMARVANAFALTRIHRDAWKYLYDYVCSVLDREEHVADVTRALVGIITGRSKMMS